MSKKVTGLRRRKFSVTAHFTAQEYLLLTGAARLAGISLARLVANQAVQYLNEHKAVWPKMERAARGMMEDT